MQCVDKDDHVHWAFASLLFSHCIVFVFAILRLLFSTSFADRGLVFDDSLVAMRVRSRRHPM